MSQNIQNPNKSKNPFRSRAFSRYLGISLVAIFIIILFVLIIWVSGARRPGIPDVIAFEQLKTPQDDDPVVVFETNLGTMKAMLFPEETPLYYEYFTSLVESGYYDGTYVCAVVDGAYALGGTKIADPNAEQPEDSDTQSIEAEVSDKLWPLRGAIASYVGTAGVWPFQKNLAGSSFLFINDIDDAYMAEDALKRTYGESLGSAFDEYGGIPNFCGEYTIFAQVYDGWDVFEQIVGATVLESYQPASDIIIQKAYISTYGENKPEE